MRVNIAVRDREQNDSRSARTVYIDKIHVTHKPAYEALKRTFDIISSLLALILFSPLMLIVALAVFLQDFHNPFFAQTRLTKDGKEFKMFKFRSMCVDAEEKLSELRELNEADGPVFKIENDPRITRIGKFIRRTSMDELPQLVNILTGSMSFVGPRPPLPSEVAQYSNYQMHRLDVKSGLTCYWQCSGRSNIGFDEWVDLDIQYIKERSLTTDLKIILKTIKAVIKKDGAE